MYRIYTRQNNHNLTVVTLLRLFQKLRFLSGLTGWCTATTFFMETARLLKLLSLFPGIIDIHLFVSLFLFLSVILNIKKITQ